MRRFFVPLLAVAGAAVLAAALFHRWRQVRAAHPEIPLGDGTAVVIEGVSWGTNQTLLREPAQWTRLKEALPPAWRWITGPPQGPHELRGIQSPHLWLSRRDLTAGRYVTVGSVEVSALTKDGSEFQSNGYHGFGSAERAERAATFGALDWRAEELRFQLRHDTLTQVVAIPNPRRGEHFPAWRPDPLPRTNSVGGFEFVLRRLQSLPRASPFVRAEWSVRRSGEDVTGWFETRAEFTDPTGNRSWKGLPASEPVWKVHLTACPVGAYPFTEQQLFPVGRVTIPRPGEFTHLALSAAASNACLHWAALTGAGGFAFRDGTNRIAQPPDRPRLGNSSSMNSQRWEFTFDTDRPQLHVLLRGPASGGRLLPGPTNQLDQLVLRARTRTGSVVKTSGHGYTSTGDGSTVSRWHVFEFVPVSPGEELELDLVLATPLQAEFTVAAPKSP